MQRRLVTSIAKSIKNSSIRYQKPIQGFQSCVGKSINSSSKSIIKEELFQQRGRFRSTSSYLSNYPIKTSDFGTVRSFSSSGAGGVDDISKELVVPSVDQLIDSLTNLVNHPVVDTLFWVSLTLYFSQRFLKFIYAKLPTHRPYEDTVFPKIWAPLYKITSICTLYPILCAIDPALVEYGSPKAIVTILISTAALHNINDFVEEYIIRLNLPFSVGDTVKIRTPVGYSLGRVTKTGQISLIWLTAERDSFALPYSRLSRTVIVRSIVQRFPLKIHDDNKISQISEDIIKMMRLDANVSLEMGLPYCICSQESSYVQLTIGCDVKNKKSEKYILRNAVRIINEHGGELLSDAQANAEVPSF